MRDWIEKFNELGVSVDQEFSIVKILGNPVEMREWQMCNFW